MLQQTITNSRLVDSALRDPTSPTGATFLENPTQLIANPTGLDATARLAEGNIKSNNARTRALTDALPNSPLASILTVLNSNQTNDIRGQLNDLRGIEKKRLGDEAKEEARVAKETALIKDYKDTGKIKDVQRVADKFYGGDFRLAIRSKTLNSQILNLPIGLEQQTRIGGLIVKYRKTLEESVLIKDTADYKFMQQLVTELTASITNGAITESEAVRQQRKIDKLATKVGAAGSEANKKAPPPATALVPKTILSADEQKTKDLLQSGNAAKKKDDTFFGKGSKSQAVVDTTLATLKDVGNALGYSTDTTPDGRTVVTNPNTGYQATERTDGNIAIKTPDNPVVTVVKTPEEAKKAISEKTDAVTEEVSGSSDIVQENKDFLADEKKRIAFVQSEHVRKTADKKANQDRIDADRDWEEDTPEELKILKRFDDATGNIPGFIHEQGGKTFNILKRAFNDSEEGKIVKRMFGFSDDDAPAPSNAGKVNDLPADRSMIALQVAETGGEKDPDKATGYELFRNNKTGQLKEVRDPVTGKRVAQSFGAYQITLGTARELDPSLVGKSDSQVIKVLRDRPKAKDLARTFYNELHGKIRSNKHTKDLSDVDSRTLAAAAYNFGGASFIRRVVDKVKPSSYQDLLARHGKFSFKKDKDGKEIMGLPEQTLRQMKRFREAFGDN